MSLTARDLMRTDSRVVHPDTSLAELDRKFVEAKVGGFPVVKDGRLVGLVSRSDVIRQLCVEQTLAEMVSDYQHGDGIWQEHTGQTLMEIGDQVGKRIETLTVNDVMRRHLITVSPEHPARDVAQLFIQHDVHRLLVAEGDQLIGIISALDFVRAIADGRIELP